jgi:prenyltransferase beta subunit
LNEINKEKLIEFIVSLQQKDGSFSGDKWGNFFKNLFEQIF